MSGESVKGIRIKDNTCQRMVLNLALAALSPVSFKRMGPRMEIMLPTMHRSM